MSGTPTTPKKRAPALYGIALFKLGKGLVFLLLALGVYSLSDNDLPQEFRSLVEWFHLDPERRVFTGIAAQLQTITPENVLVVAGGTLAYSLLALVEGVGLMLRFSWAGWLAMAESAIFIPVEIFELSKGFTPGMAGLLALNTFICWYLFSQRHRLFRHHFASKDKPE